jgi:phage-related protein
MADWRVVYYENPNDSCPVKDYIDSLDIQEQVKTLNLIELLQDHGPHLRRPYADLLKDGIHELRIKLSGTQIRILYFFFFQNIIFLTNVFNKHTDRVSESEINTAKKCREDTAQRFSLEDFAFRRNTND